jgi:hypothetical protein
MSFLGGFSAPFVRAFHRRHQRENFELTTAPTQFKKWPYKHSPKIRIFLKKRLPSWHRQRPLVKTAPHARSFYLNKILACRNARVSA